MAKKSVVPDSNHVKILGFGKSEIGERFVWLSFKDGANRARALLRIDKLTDSSFDNLNQLGAHLVSQDVRRDLIRRIQEAGSQDSAFTVATQLGWHRKYFVHPARQPVKAGDAILYAGDMQEIASRYLGKGTLKDWKKITTLARGNSRLMLALSLAFVGPVGPLLHARQVAIQLTGPSGSGKTPVAVVTGSVWGWGHDDLGFVDTWNSTLNKLELAALGHNHALLILDETRVTDPRQVLDASIHLEKAREKGRLTNVTPERSWWVPLLSTSNRTVDELGNDAKFPVDDAYRSRLIDVPNPNVGHGIFEILHGFADVRDFSKYLVDLARRNHGRAGLAFVDHLEEWYRKDAKDLRKWLKARHKNYRQAAATLFDQPGRDHLTIHERFATIYAAGRLAMHFKLLPWKWKALRNAVLACEGAHLALIASGPTSSTPTLLQRLADHLGGMQGSLIELASCSSTPSWRPSVADVYRSTHKKRGEFLMTDAALTAFAGDKTAANNLKAAMARQKLLDTAGKGSKRKFSVKRKLPSGERIYFVAIDTAILTHQTVAQ